MSTCQTQATMLDKVIGIYHIYCIRRRTYKFSTSCAFAAQDTILDRYNNVFTMHVIML